MNTKALKQKILDLAIHGKLLPLEKVEKIRKEEPASVLLEKIRAEKQEKIAKGELKKDKNDSFIFVGDDKRHYEKFADGSVKDIEDEIPFELPDGWSWVRGSEILSQMTSRKPTGDFFNYIDIDAIDNKKHKIKQPKKIKVSDAPSRASRELFSGDILFSLVRPYLENIAFISTEFENCIASTGFFVCRPNGNIFPKYLYFLLISKYVISGLNEFMKGDNSPSISSDDIIKFFFPLPPLSEQKLIVAEIEKIFAQIDLLEQNKTDLQTAIKQAKSKILDLAIHGKLVSQDPNDEPASVLLEKIRAEKEAKIAKGELKRDKNDSYIYKSSTDNCHYQKNADGSIINIEDEIPFEVPESWCWCRFGEICEFIGGVSYKKNDITNTGIRILRGGNIQAGKIIDEIDDVFVPFSYFDKNNSVYENDIVLVASTGSNLLIGKTGFAYKNLQNTQIGAFLRIIRTDNSFYAKYNNIVLLSEYYKTYIRNIAGGTNINNVKTEYLSNFLFPLPPLTEQTRIVAKIEELFTLLDNIQNNLI